ncbi:MAG TPA: flippase [Candidatus Dormibacteraeota bacterium]|nr:flippase [Candidatus Dormibacteraeota bacterium]
MEATAPVRHQARSGTVLARNVGALAGSQIITWCAGLAWALFVPRALGATGTGVFTLSVAASGILGVVVGLGTRPLLVREISVDPSKASRLIPTAIVMRAILSLPMLAFVGVFARLGNFDREQVLALFLGWGVCFLFALFEPIQAGLQALEKMQFLAYSDILTKTVVSLVSVALVVIGFRHATDLLWLSVVVLSAVLILHVVWMRKYFTVDWRIRPEDLWSLTKRSLPYLGFAVFFTFYLWIDALMLGVMTPTKVLGWYGLPTKLFGTLMFIPVILSTAWLPRLSAAYLQGDKALWEAARGPLQVVVALSLPVCVGVVLVTPNLIKFLYGPDFLQSIPVMVVLALSVPPMYLNIMVNQVLIARHQQMLWTKAMALACVVNPVLNLVFIPYFQNTRGNGAIGAAVSLLVTEIVLAGIGVAVIRGLFNRAFFARLARAAVATAGMGLAVLAARSLGLAPAILVGLIVYPILAIVLRVLSREELAQLIEMVQSRRKVRVDS